MHFASLGLVSAQVAHDMRSPLSVLKVLLSSLDERVSSSDQSTDEVLHVMSRANHRLENICEDLLAKQRGTSEPKRGFNLHEILDELIIEAKANRSLSGVNFHKDYYSKSIFFLGRQNRLQRVFANIIRNAIEAIDFEGSIIVSTHVKNSEVIVSIQDNGVGMSQEAINQLLITGGSKGKIKGNGIGMMFVKEVLKNHKGKLSIESIEGSGTTVHIQFPYKQVEQRLEDKAVGTKTLSTQLVSARGI